MRRSFGHVICIVAVFLYAVARSSAVEFSRPGESEGPTPIEFRVYFVDVDGIDSAEQNFTANVFFQVHWHDPRLAHDGTGPVARQMSEIWNPGIQMVNQQRLWRTFPEVGYVTPDGSVSYKQRVWGQFSQPLKLRDFPFDQHLFTVTFVAAGNQEGEVEFIPDPDSDRTSGISTNLSIADWEVIETRFEPIGFVPMPGDVAVPGFVASFVAKRESGYFVLKVIVPLVLILAMSWVVFWIDPSESGTQIGVATTTMLTLIAYRFAMGTNLPNISYLTRMDYFILASTVLVFVSLMEVMLTSLLAKSGRLEKALWIDRVARFLIPAIFVVVTVQAFVL